MSILNNSLLLGADAGAGGYQISRSLRFNSADSAYLSRTPASAGNRKTFTFSCWIKRSALQSGTSNTYMQVFSAGTSGTARDVLFFDTDTDDTLAFYSANGIAGAATLMFRTNAVFRDASAWMHIMLAVDTTQATAANRVKLYVNGTEQTFSTVNYPSQNAEGYINLNNAHYIATHPPLTEYFSGYLADIHFIDGQALTPSSFAETNATTGQWVPKAYTGSYGTNGFRLDFSDNSAATATTLGKDRAGSNNWTPNNLSVTAGAGNDSLVDTPTSYGTDTGAGGDVRGNYATLNPLVNFNGSTLSNGNLDITCVSLTGQWRTQKGGWGFYGGKFYFEATLNAGGSAGNSGVGIGRITLPHSGNLYPGQSGGSYGYGSDGSKIDSGSISWPWSTWTVGDVIGVAADLTAGTVAFYKNGTLQGSMTGLDTTLTYEALVGSASGTPSQYSLNFGQRPFAFPVSGFKALCDTNLPAPVVAKPNTAFDAVPYTGSSGSQNITTNFSPDLVWVKTRNATTDHELYDTVRGAGIRLSSNATLAESNLGANGLTSFNSNGFTVPSTANYGINGSGYTYAAWAWDAGSSTVTNTSGSISSQVRANASAGFSVVSWSGVNGANGTIGHGLGVAPQFVILKNRGTTDNWRVYHVSVGATGFLQLASTGATVTSDEFQNTSPTSTVFYLRGNTWNAASNNYIAYCFAPVAGYSAFGSYTGNGSADGPAVWLGFRPRWVLIKGSSFATTGWAIYDAVRNTFNVANNLLTAESSSAETNYPEIDLLSNGFKLRGTNPTWNYSGQTHIYAAFAESPFQYARAR